MDDKSYLHDSVNRHHHLFFCLAWQKQGTVILHLSSTSWLHHKSFVASTIISAHSINTGDRLTQILFWIFGSEFRSLRAPKADSGRHFAKNEKVTRVCHIMRISKYSTRIQMYRRQFLVFGCSYIFKLDLHSMLADEHEYHACKGFAKQTKVSCSTKTLYRSGLRTHASFHASLRSLLGSIHRYYCQRKHLNRFS